MRYEEARAAAQAVANKEGFDLGLWVDHFGGWYFRRLPLPQNRYGCDLTCEVVKPEKEPRK